jgi:hypothetical protein
MAEKILVHCCCGPCSLEPVAWLVEKGFEPVLCWTNPNIAPVAEHDRRFETFSAWAAENGFETVCARSDREAWERLVAPAGTDRQARCARCYAMRLSAAAEKARELGIGSITTTLAVSPYQLYDTCMDALVKIARANGLEPVAHDWRDRYPEATRRSRELGMYRQNYCGCRFSAAEAAIDRNKARDARSRAQKEKS